ncbi:hypothetical protein MHU86_2975 [Fragilaria crotonensis]|nr:hypothetical protein MHU86_2975 [Fragilaria crotonensis]
MSPKTIEKEMQEVKNTSLKSHRSFLQKKYSWSDPVWLSIAWDAFKKCACCPSLPQSVNRSKLVHNWLNLGAQRAKFGTGGAVTELERSCPYCKNAEDFTHMLTCGDPRALQARSAATTALQKVLSLLGACGFAVLRAITAWTLTPLEPISINVPDIVI